MSTYPDYVYQTLARARGDGSRYNRMMQFIDPSAPSAYEEIRRIRKENQKERIAPYRPSIDPELAKLFAVAIPEEKTSPSLVDWNFLDKDDGQPGEPAEWVKKQIKQLKKWGDDDDLHKEMLEDMKQRHQWIRNIPPPSIPKRYDPNEPPFDPDDIFDFMDDDLDADTWYYSARFACIR